MPRHANIHQSIFLAALVFACAGSLWGQQELAPIRGALPKSQYCWSQRRHDASQKCCKQMLSECAPAARKAGEEIAKATRAALQN